MLSMKYNTPLYLSIYQCKKVVTFFLKKKNNKEKGYEKTKNNGGEPLQQRGPYRKYKQIIENGPKIGIVH
jgi:hypothetical protein